MSVSKSRLNFTDKEISELTIFVQQNDLLKDGTRSKPAEREKLWATLAQQLHKSGT